MRLPGNLRKDKYKNKIYPDGSYEFLCEIENAGGNLQSWEPHAVVLESGKILVHIRVQDGKDFCTLFQCESVDGGKSFTKPHQVLVGKEDVPAHLIQDGDTIISVYSYRNKPYGIRAMFSKDEGENWETD